jgi:Xaa-Pro aminopeptidase
MAGRPEERVAVRNAASPGQVRRAKKEDRFNRENELKDIHELMQRPSFRRFIWRVLTQCKAEASVFEQSSKIYYNSGQQDIGHFIKGEIVQGAEAEWLQLLQERFAAARTQLGADELDTPSEDGE